MTALKTNILQVFVCFSLVPGMIGNHFDSMGLNTAAQINPVLAWNTFLGENNGTDYGFGTVIDRSGYVHVTGISNESWGTPVRSYSGAADAFVAKLDPRGNLIWNTFLGGNASNDYGEEIFVDGSGNVYVIGLTDISFGNGTWGNPIRPYMGQGDAFVAKLDSGGNLIWNTFLGSGVLDWGKGLVVTQDGTIVVMGFSDAAWGNPIVRPFTAIKDAFVAKLDPDGNLMWTSFFGGNGFDEGSGIVADTRGNLYLAGFSTATVGSATWGNPVRGYSGGGDAFVATLDLSGSLKWNTFLGGNGYEYGREAAVDSSGNVHITGISNAFWGNPIRDYTAGIDTFVANLDSKGNLQWNTFLGGNGDDEGYGIDADAKGNVYITGFSTAAWGKPLRPYTALDDAFEAQLEPAGRLVSNTFLGGSGYDYGNGLDVDQDGNVYVTGSSTATWGTPVSDYTPPTDAFVVKLDSPPLVVSTSLDSTMDPGLRRFTVTFSEDLNNPAGSTNPDDATNPDNYLLIDKGTNGAADTTSCAGGVAADDTRITITSVGYDRSALTARVTLASGLTAGKYRLLVCGTTSIVDLSQNALAGNGITSGTDYIFEFTVQAAASTATSLPNTGFAPQRLTRLPLQPAYKSYSPLGNLWLEIPSLNVKSNIVGIPRSEHDWDVTWLGNDIGWLHGTAFPSWTGNSVLTGHNYNSNGLPGPFLDIKNLKYGDTIIVHVYGEKYLFQVQFTQLANPASTEYALEHLKEHSYLTLITCQGYNPQDNSYTYRRIVRAILVDVEMEAAP